MKQIIILILFLQCHIVSAQSASTSQSAVPYTDYVISKITQRLNENKVPAALVVGGTLVIGTKTYIESETSDIDGMLIFETRLALEYFVSKYSQEQLRDMIGFTSQFNPYNKQDINLFLNKPLQVMELTGIVEGLRVAVKLTDKEALLKQELGQKFSVLTKINKPRVFKSKSLKGDEGNVILVNKTLKHQDSNSYILLNKFYLPYADSLFIGRITDYLITAKAIIDPKDIFQQVQQQTRRNFIVRIAENGCLKKDALPVNYLLLSKLFPKKFKSNIQDDLEDHISDSDSHIRTCQRNAIKNGYAFDIDLDTFTAMPFDYQSITAEDKVGALPNDIHPMIIKALPNFAEKAKDLTILPYAFGQGMLVSESGHGQVAKVDASQKLIPVYPFRVITDKSKEIILKNSKVLSNLKQLYPNIIEPNYVDPEYRFSFDKVLNGKKLSDLIYKKWGDRRNEILTILLDNNENKLNAYLSALPIENLSIKDSASHDLYFNKYASPLMKEWYTEQMINLPDGSEMSFDDLAEMNIVVNGKKYSSLSGMISHAKRYLNPSFLQDKVKIYGIVNDPATNILMLKKDELSSIDYRYSGVAHPCQDLAMTLYQDVFYDVVNPKLAQNQANIDVKIDKAKKLIMLNHNYQLDSNRQMLMDLYLFNVLKPTLIIAANNYKKDINHWKYILQSAIFTAGFFNNNLFADGKNGWLALAILAEISSPTVMNKERPSDEINFMIQP